MQRSLGRFLLFISMAIGFSCTSTLNSSLVEGGQKSSLIPQGGWKDLGRSDYFVSLDKGVMTLVDSGRIQETMVLLAVEPDHLRVCRFGRDSVFRWSYDGNNLVLEDLDRREIHRLVRSQARLEEAQREFRFPEPTPLEPSTLEQIQRELSQRMQKEQGRLRAQVQPSRTSEATASILGSKSEPGSSSFGGVDLELAEITTDNTQYIRQLLPKVGWIDVRRFGYSTSKAAFLLVQHSWDGPLMAAVLPALQEDVEAGRMEADAYALLFDRLQLAMGRRQRYGSQVANDSTGALVVLPVESPEKVDVLRASLGMKSLKEYVQIFGASEVRFSQQCQPGK